MSKSLGKTIVKYLVIVLGSAVYAAGFQFFLYPNAIVAGGVTGVAMIIHTFVKIPIGLMIIVFNIPLFIVAWRHFGLGFMIGSLVGMAVSSLFVDFFAVLGLAATRDAMLAAIIGGVIKGAGLGVIYYVGATTGGVDIVAKLLRKKLAQINFGTIILIMDTLIIVIYAALVGNYESAMYSVICMFVVSRVVDLVLYGIDNSALCFIISENSQELTHRIIDGPLRRGVTILEGEGAWSHHQKHVIMCVIKRTQIAELRYLVRTVDEEAFFIMTDVKNVFGKGFESISEVR